MRNIVDAIISVVKDPKHKLKEYSVANNRANQMGAALEDYIMDVFADTVGVTDEQVRYRKISQVFAYLGNQNNPPDSMLKNRGVAIEVKKIESPNAPLALNSSYPKAKLFADSKMISAACRDCETWTERDMIYAVGVLNGESLKSLAFVYGEDYCASKETYERIRTNIKKGVESIPNVNFAETNELGRVNMVDPLGITYLRIRGMWHIENPFVTFNYIYERDITKDFNFMAVISKKKIAELTNFNKLEELAENMEGLSVIDAQIKNPNNPAQLRNVKLITFTV